MQKITKTLPSAHHCTTLSGCIFATKACIAKKNLINSNISSRHPHNMPNFGPRKAEISLPVWGMSANFNGFRIMAALLHGTLEWASAKLCGVEERAPPIFGRVVVTLGIGAHFYLSFFLADKTSQGNTVNCCLLFCHRSRCFASRIVPVPPGSTSILQFTYSFPSY